MTTKTKKILLICALTLFAAALLFVMAEDDQWINIEVKQ